MLKAQWRLAWPDLIFCTKHLWSSTIIGVTYHPLHCHNSLWITDIFLTPLDCTIVTVLQSIPNHQQTYAWVRMWPSQQHVRCHVPTAHSQQLPNCCPHNSCRYSTQLSIECSPSVLHIIFLLFLSYSVFYAVPHRQLTI